ncbi:glucose-1-phosphate adenylyltransferase [Candidatus Woesearchaeota archaeon]|nr:MAG: glucose-1-phosphate adenylyltransferase [Candidatus Woesearchaeota archaeon]
MVLNEMAFVLAGGKGSRLKSLTKSRAKPAVVFGGMYRLVDFVLSNLSHSRLNKITVLTQYEPDSLSEHLRLGWEPKYGASTDRYLKQRAAAQGANGGWYAGTADAITQNIRRIVREEPDLVNVFGADHVYLMDISQMNRHHCDAGAALTIAALPVPVELAANELGVLVVDKDGRVVGFEEKVPNPTEIPGKPGMVFASMGNYAFRTDALLEELIIDAEKERGTKEDVARDRRRYTTNDFGYDIIPSLIERGLPVYAYDFSTNEVPEGQPQTQQGYWRDVGTIDQFFAANMELTDVTPPLNLYIPRWQVRTYVPESQPAKVVRGGESDNSLLAPGVIISKGLVRHSVLGYGVRSDDAFIEEAVLQGYNVLEPGAVVRRAIIDKGVRVPSGVTVGVDREADRARGFHISAGGIVVVPKGYTFE